jgi:hypothetical protein
MTRHSPTEVRAQGPERLASSKRSSPPEGSS